MDNSVNKSIVAPKSGLLDLVRVAIYMKHYRMRTEEAYKYRIRIFILSP